VLGKLRELEVRVQVLVMVEKGVRSASVGEEALFPLRDLVSLVEDCRLSAGIPHIFVQSSSISGILASPRHT
jgi:hypothetical protein